MTRLLLTFILLLSISSIYAQTASIHSQRTGLQETHDHFGAIMEMPPLYSLELISTEDGPATVMTYGYTKHDQSQTYTIVDHPVFNAENAQLDSLQKLFPQVQEWIGFEPGSPIHVAPKAKSSKRNAAWAILLLAGGWALSSKQD